MGVGGEQQQQRQHASKQKLQRRRVGTTTRWFDDRCGTHGSSSSSALRVVADSGGGGGGGSGGSSGGSSSQIAVERPKGNSSTGQAMANSVNILLGVGLLSVPYALQQGGWAGLGVLATLGAMTNYTGKALIRCQTAGSLPALPAAAGEEGQARELCVTQGDDLLATGDEGDSCLRRRPLLSYEDIGEVGLYKRESSCPIALNRTDGGGIRTPDLLIPVESLVSTLDPMK
jgi:hypothetical protein